MSQPILTYFITGANRGLGLEFVHQLSQKGQIVFAGARTPAQAEELHKIKAAYPNVHIIAVDTTDETSVKVAAEEVERLSPTGIDILINNAAIIGGGETASKTTKSDINRVFDNNVTGTLVVTNAFLPALRKRHTRKLINISSRMGSLIDTTVVNISYKISKAAENMLTVSFANELRSEEFTVLTLCPGWVQTDMGGSQAPITPPQSIKGLLEVIGKATPADSGRFLTFEGETASW